MELSDPALRKGATGKLSHAFKLARELQAEMDSWWSLNPVTLAIELKEDKRTIDLIAKTSPLPPTDDWYHTAADIMQNYRDALNRLTYTLCALETAPSKPRDVTFPIRRNDESWASWKKGHSMLPNWIQDRFYAFQPYISGRDSLRLLTETNNTEKHADGFRISITLTELHIGSGEMTVEGSEDQTHLVQFAAGVTPDLLTERMLIGTIEMPSRVVDFGLIEASPAFAFTPMIRFGDEEIPLLGALSLVGTEVAWAISFITGLVDSSTEPPDRFDL